MMNIDQKALFTALAFVTIAQKGSNAGERESGEQVRQLAGLIESFCAEHLLGRSTPQSHDADATDIDQVIERHIRELQQRQETRLPADKETLVELCGRLCQRKAQRMQRDFYANATEAKLADLVLQYLDEEIEDDRCLS